MATTTLRAADQPQRNERIDYAEILPHRTKMLILAGTLIGLFLAALDQTIVSTALPAIVNDLQGLDLLAWISTGYLLASTTMVPIYGKLSDLYGRKIILLWGIVVFLIGSVLCGLATTMIQLIIYRVIQGVGAAALTSTAFAVPADLFAPAERARYQGLFGAVFGLSSVIGPFLGGLLTDLLSWHYVFLVNIPVGLIALAFIVRTMPRLASGIRAPIDWLGTVLLIVAVVPLLLGLTLDKALYPWTSPLILGLFAVALVATVLFLVVESRVASPVISLDLFRIRTYNVVIAASVLNGAAFFGAILFLSLFMVNVVGVSATAAGTALIPLTLALVVGSIISSALVQRLGRYKLIILVGFAIMLLGFWLLSQMDAQTTRLDVIWRMIVLGVGIGPALPLLNLAAQNALPYEKVGSGTASRQFFQQLGQALGAAIFGVILSTTLTSQITATIQPIVAQLPSEIQSRFDPAQFRQSSAGGEGVATEQESVSERIEQEISGQFAEQRRLVTAAVQNNDPQAQQILLNSPETPEEFKPLLQAGGLEALVQTQLDQQYAQIETALRSGDVNAIEALKNDLQLPQELKDRLGELSPEVLGNPQAVDGLLGQIRSSLDAQQPQIVAQARERALAEALTGLETAEVQALTKGQQLGTQIDAAIKQSFAASITQIYSYAIWLVVAAFALIAFLMPELPLRKTNRDEAPTPAFE